MERHKVRRLNAESLWLFALKALGARSHSAAELRDKLRQRAERAADVEDVLARLKEQGYLDDRRFAEGFAAARLSDGRWGPLRVLRDLRQRRVAATIAEGAVRQAFQDVNQQDRIEEWIRRKYRSASGALVFQNDQELASAYRRLLRAGFRGGDVLAVLKRFAQNPDLLDHLEPVPEEASGEG
jgi:regulatory protein